MHIHYLPRYALWSSSSLCAKYSCNLFTTSCYFRNKTQELSPLKNIDGIGENDNAFSRGRGQSPLKAFSPKYKDHRYFKSSKSNRPSFDDFEGTSRPPQELIENDQQRQLEDIKNWFKENISGSGNVESNSRKWEKFSHTRKFGFSLEGELLYGIHPITNALRHQRRELHHLYIQKRPTYQALPEMPAIDEIVSLAKELQIPIVETPHHKLEQMSAKRPHQGVCLDASPLPEVFHDVHKDCQVDTNTSHHPLWLVLYKVKDPMNLGAILRSAHFLSVDRVIRTRNDSCPLTPVVSKASSGAMESMPLYTVHCRLAELVNHTDELGGYSIIVVILMVIVAVSGLLVYVLEGLVIASCSQLHRDHL